MMKTLIPLLLTLIMSMEVTMPVFSDNNYRNNRPPRPPRASQNIPAWMQGNNASQYVSPNVGQGSSPYQFTPGYGEDNPTSGPGTRRRGRGSPALGVGLERPTLAPQTMSGPGTVRRDRGTPLLDTALDRPRSQVYVANPQTYTAPPAWLQSIADALKPATFNPRTGLWVPQQQSQINDEKPWRIQNPDGSWAYLQSNGEYLTATGTAGQPDITPRNSYVNLAPFQQLVPTPPPTQAYSPFSSYYNRWGRGGGGGGSGGYNYRPQIPAWMMGLNSWNFGE